VSGTSTARYAPSCACEQLPFIRAAISLGLLGEVYGGGVFLVDVAIELGAHALSPCAGTCRSSAKSVVQQRCAKTDPRDGRAQKHVALEATLTGVLSA
jgi:hypothetical protein